MLDISLGNLLAWALQVAALVIAGVLLPALLRMTSPRPRLTYLRAVLVICLALPLLQPWAPTSPKPLPTVMAGLATGIAPASAIDDDTAAGADATAGGGGGRSWPDWRWWPLGSIAVAIFAAGLVLRVTWLALGLASLARLRRSSVPLAPRPDAVDDAALMVGADADFRVSTRVVGPVTFGLRRPVVLVPPGFAAFTPTQQTAVAAHELLHVARRDWVRTLGDELILSVLWFHPALWWLVDQIHLHVEQVVDRDVVRVVGARKPYLEALLKLAAAGPTPMLQPASLFLKHGHLAQRVALLVMEASMSRVRLVASFVVVLAVLAGGGWFVVQAFPLRAVLDSAVLPSVPALAAFTKAPPPPPAKVTADQPASGQQARPTVPPSAQSPVPGATSAASGVWPSLIKTGTAVYPRSALAEKRGGIVGLEVSLDTAGSVTDARVFFSGSISDPKVPPQGTAGPDLEAAALQGVRTARFAPLPRPWPKHYIGINFDASTGTVTWLPVPPPPPPEISGDKKVVTFRASPTMAGIQQKEPLDPAAVARLRAAIQAERGNPSNYFALASLYERAGDAAEAESLMMQVQSVRPNDPTVYLQMAGFYNRQGQFDKTIAALSQRAAIDSSNPEAAYTLATYYWDKAYRDLSLSATQKRDIIEKGLGYADAAIRMKPDYMEALTYKNLLLRLQATTETDPAAQQALIAEADKLRDQALKLKEARNAWAAVPSNAVRIGGTIAPPKKIKNVAPVYPADALAARVAGVVIVETVIGEDGRVRDTRVLRSIPLLDQAALDAVNQWEFAPTTVNGAPVPVVMTVTANFMPDGVAGGVAGGVTSGVPGGVTGGLAGGVVGGVTAGSFDAPPPPPPPPPPPAGWSSGKTSLDPTALKVGGAISPPKRLVNVNPVYPPEATEARVQGVVILEVLIGTDGKVENSRILRSIPMLDQAATDAVRQWVFTVTSVNSGPVKVVMTVTVNFTLQ